ncbi:hypothetical protein GCM10027447_35300 [Glycomyces halotolerans]
MVQYLADGTQYVQNNDGTVTVGTGSESVTMTTEAFDEFISKMESTITDLGYTKSMVTNHEVVRIRGELDFIPDPAMFQRVDALNLKLGTFDDAKELAEVYRENFYKGKADQIERIYHGYDTGKVVSEEIATSYVDEDGNVAADITTVDSGFDTNEGIDDSDVHEAEEVAEQEAEESTDDPADEQPGTDPSENA